ncbi:MAG: carbon-nitrogen hydrolase family protein [bacterium]|nr:carbon-nitrogen hydrolase family protein [bacterium]
MLKVALIHRVFPGAERHAELVRALTEAREAGATLAVLPELPLDPWFPAERAVSEDDAEVPGGERARRLADAAKSAGIAVLGGAVVRDGQRHNRALLVEAGGREVAHYDKVHLPDEEGFWEAQHYAPGSDAPRRIDDLGFPLGLQICSDLNRPTGCQMLAAQGAGAILAPRATPAESYDNWRSVIRADALTSAAYVISVNRPAGGEPVPLGSPSLAVAPDGEVLVETTDPLTLVTLEMDRVVGARRGYPGYLDYRAAFYADGWSGLDG